MNIKFGDYVALKSFNEVKPFYNSIEIVNNCDIIAGNPCVDYFNEPMLTAMKSNKMYKVVDVDAGVDYSNICVEINGAVFEFSDISIKDVYRLTKVNQTSIESEE